MSTERPVALVVFTRDLRVSDHPALDSANSSDVVCAFVHDAALQAGRPMHPLRRQFLADCLADLDASLRILGSRLDQRRGDWVDEVLRLAAQTGATSIHVSDDVTPYAQRRLTRLAKSAGRVAVCRHPGLTAVPPGAITPVGGDHYRVFTPYYRRWATSARRPLLPTPGALRPPGPSQKVTRNRPASIPAAKSRPDAGRGGERAAAKRLAAWVDGDLSRYGTRRDDLAEPVTSGLSRDLHFGSLSPRQVENAVLGRPGADPYLRQLCWRDFYLQILWARPEVAWSDYVQRGRPGRSDSSALEAWRQGLTGVPIVDAAMRQLARQGSLPNRARMIAASFLTRQLGLDWRQGANHFLEHLVDADIALNNLNWQWMAGRGTGTNPHRVLSPTRQARRFDPDGAYVKRHIPELRTLDPPLIHEPWRLGRCDLERLDYPAPIIRMGEAE